jgi:hypothetical protein
MNAYPMIFRLALFLGVLVASLYCGTGCSSLPLHASDERIRERILSITPLGTSLGEAERQIKRRIRPETFHRWEALPGLASKPAPNRTDVRMLTMQPAGHHIVIGCNLGRINGSPLPFLAMVYTQVSASWVFDSSGHLAEVGVGKNTEGM